MSAEQAPYDSPILVTGASGLIGTQLASAISGDPACGNHHQVIGLDVVKPHDEAGLSEFVQVDLTDEESTRTALERVKQRTGGHLASVVHLAAYYDFSGEPSPMYEALTVEGSRRLMRLLRSLGFAVEQFIFSSSLLVMHPDPGGKSITEFSATRAEWAYPLSKLKAEQALREEHGDIPLVILRIAGVYDEKCHSLPISQQIVRIYEEQLESHVFPGDPSHGQAFIHLRDLVQCICRTIARRSALPNEEVFLIAEPDVMSYQELQNEIGELLHGTEWKTVRIPKAVARAGAWIIDKLAGTKDKPFIKPWMINLADDHYEPNIAHARSQLVWEPRERLRTTLPRMIEFLRENPEEFYAVNKLGEPAVAHK